MKSEKAARPRDERIAAERTSALRGLNCAIDKRADPRSGVMPVPVSRVMQHASIAAKWCWDVTWKKTKSWDLEHSNVIEIRDREADLPAINHAFAMYQNNRADSFQLYLALAEQGSVWSMFEVAQSYAQGRGIEYDSALAQEWFERAFAGGCQRAMLKCAQYAYFRGDHAACQATLQVGVDQKWASAMFWQAWYRYKHSDTRDTCRAIRPMLEKAASQGHPAAELLLINLMCLGKYGLLNRVRGSILAVRAARRLN